MSFWITVYLNPDADDRNAENTLASWEGPLHSWNGFKDLIEAGKLTQTRADFFPSLYRGLACDVLPILPVVKRPKISAYYTPEMLQERIAKCPPDAQLGIMIWDMG